MTRTAALLLIIDLGMVAAFAQGGGDSPYSAYGFGDLVPSGQVSQTLMAGTGLALTEPYGVILGNPASYAALARPVFEAGAAFRHTRTTSSQASSTRKDAEFMGFSLGVPFAKGKWGLALGLTPFSEVGYSTSQSSGLDEGTVKYLYSGNGGLDRAYFGLGHTLYAQRADSVGNAGTRVTLGADFNFIFGSIEQTREALYSQDAGYNNIKVFSALVLRAPTADASVMWQGDLTRKKHRDDVNWRWTAGASISFPASLRAKYSNLVTSYTSRFGIEAVRDTIANDQGLKGQVEVPVSLGFGLGIQNARWGFTAEVKQQDWSAATIEVPGYSLPAPLRNAIFYGAAARFQPGTDGGVFHRVVYRMGLKYAQAPQEVRGSGLESAAATVGISFPLNAVQTNSWLHLGGEFGQRGSTENGLIQERYATLWVGVAFTPWRGERWFTPPKIQ
ncbi:MAG: hypothetical protein K8H89_15455 [Flavobacteriales bacterium]|jgi:hypothetical protein|nr:hypothetical protein [Flavobacteriales bacterium]MCB0757195.1 hypothetical protein [Flavobacteriales bacterium]